MFSLDEKAWTRLHWLLLGGIQSACTMILIAAVCVTAAFIDHPDARFWLFQLAGGASGVESVYIVYRIRIAGLCK